jgi:hypothetical protein
LEDARRILPLPEEPANLRAETRALLEEWPEEGARVITFDHASHLGELLLEAGPVPIVVGSGPQKASSYSAARRS